MLQYMRWDKCNKQWASLLNFGSVQVSHIFSESGTKMIADCLIYLWSYHHKWNKVGIASCTFSDVIMRSQMQNFLQQER